jgi:hypothetical protein
MANYTLHENQYIPHKTARSLPSGLPACETYYYFKNEKGQTIDIKTLKPYRGTQLNRYWIKDKKQAEDYLKEINK